MMMADWSIDIEEELRRESLRHKKHQESLVDDVNTILAKELEQESEITAALKREDCNLTNVNFKKLNPKNIYNQNQIRKICIRYRLRFLDSQYFKGEIPYEAILKIKELQKKYDIKANSFKIIAPSKLFELGDECEKDPLLFLNLGNGYYYFVYKWGNDLAWHRKLLAWPLQNPTNAIICIATCLAIIVYSMPKTWFVNPAGIQDITYFRMFLFFYLFIASCGLTLLFGLTFHKNFNEQEWDSQYFN